MEALRDNTPCAVINPRTGERIGSQYASEVWQSIIANAHATGDPGLVFIDRINADNPNPHLGQIESVNPCGEQPLLPYESCNLASINLAKMVCILAHNTPEVDWEKLARTVKTTVHMLDNVIDMNRYPLPEIEEMSKKTRRIGLGVMGWADMLIQMNIRYDSEEALALAEEVMGFIRKKHIMQPLHWRKVRGAYPAFDGITDVMHPYLMSQHSPNHHCSDRHHQHHCRLFQRDRAAVRAGLHPQRHG